MSFVNYPSVDDPEYYQKILNKPEFHRNKTPDASDKSYQDVCKSTETKLLPHQQFLKNFFSPRTGVNSILLFHGTGSGKTCSAISIAENFKDFVKEHGTKIYVIFTKPKIYYDELIGTPTSIKCGGYTYLDKLTRDYKNLNDPGVWKREYRKAQHMVHEYYDIGIGGPQAFLNRPINFDNSVVIIDEVHTIVTQDSDTNNESIYKKFLERFKQSVNCKLILLSATPMWDSYMEIIPIINLLKANNSDNNTLLIGDVKFKKNNQLMSASKNLLLQKTKGYVSYFRGENELTFPKKIMEGEFVIISNVIKKELNITDDVLSKEIFNNEYLPKLKSNHKNLVTSFTRCVMSKNQTLAYFKNAEVEGKLKKGTVLKLTVSTKKSDEKRNHIIFNASKLLVETETGNVQVVDVKKSNQNEGTIELTSSLTSIKKIIVPSLTSIAAEGLSDIAFNLKPFKTNRIEGPELSMNKVFEVKPNGSSNSTVSIIKAIYPVSTTITPPKIGTQVHLLDNHTGKSHLYTIIDVKGEELTFDKEIPATEHALEMIVEKGIYSYSSKFYTLLKRILTNEASFPMFVFMFRVEEGINLLENVLNHNLKRKVRVEVVPSERRSQEKILSRFNQKNNRNGKVIGILLGTRVVETGVTLKHVREIHVLTPHWNSSRIDQIIGRGIRHCSHIDLAEEDPENFNKVSVFLYASVYGDSALNSLKPVDINKLQKSLDKDYKIKQVTRILKQSAIDCAMHKTVNEAGSNFSRACDYNRCKYLCQGVPEEKITEVDSSTYNLIEHSGSDIEEIKQEIYKLFKEKHAWDLKELYSHLSPKFKNSKLHPDDIKQLIAFAVELIKRQRDLIYDKYNNLGYLIKRGKYYIFNGITTLKTASYAERSAAPERISEIGLVDYMMQRSGKGDWFEGIQKEDFPVVEKSDLIRDYSINYTLNMLQKLEVPTLGGVKNIVDRIRTSEEKTFLELTLMKFVGHLDTRDPKDKLFETKRRVLNEKLDEIIPYVVDVYKKKGIVLEASKLLNSDNYYIGHVLKSNNPRGFTKNLTWEKAEFNIKKPTFGSLERLSRNNYRIGGIYACEQFDTKTYQDIKNPINMFMRQGVEDDNSSFFHAVLHGTDSKYNQLLIYQHRLDYVSQYRERLANEIDPTLFQSLNGGVIANELQYEKYTNMIRKKKEMPLKYIWHLMQIKTNTNIYVFTDSKLKCIVKRNAKDYVRKDRPCMFIYQNKDTGKYEPIYFIQGKQRSQRTLIKTFEHNNLYSQLVYDMYIKACQGIPMFETGDPQPPTAIMVQDILKSKSNYTIEEQVVYTHLVNFLLIKSSVGRCLLPVKASGLIASSSDIVLQKIEGKTVLRGKQSLQVTRKFFDQLDKDIPELFSKIVAISVIKDQIVALQLQNGLFVPIHYSPRNQAADLPISEKEYYADIERIISRKVPGTTVKKIEQELKKQENFNSMRYLLSKYVLGIETTLQKARTLPELNKIVKVDPDLQIKDLTNIDSIKKLIAESKVYQNFVRISNRIEEIVESSINSMEDKLIQIHDELIQVIVWAIPDESKQKMFNEFQDWLINLADKIQKNQGNLETKDCSEPICKELFEYILKHNVKFSNNDTKQIRIELRRIIFLRLFSNEVPISKDIYYLLLMELIADKKDKLILTGRAKLKSKEVYRTFPFTEIDCEFEVKFPIGDPSSLPFSFRTFTPDSGDDSEQQKVLQKVTDHKKISKVKYKNFWMVSCLTDEHPFYSMFKAVAIGQKWLELPSKKLDFTENDINKLGKHLRDRIFEECASGVIEKIENNGKYYLLPVLMSEELSVKHYCKSQQEDFTRPGNFRDLLLTMEILRKTIYMYSSNKNESGQEVGLDSPVYVMGRGRSTYYDSIHLFYVKSGEYVAMLPVKGVKTVESVVDEPEPIFKELPKHKCKKTVTIRRSTIRKLPKKRCVKTIVLK